MINVFATGVVDELFAGITLVLAPAVAEDELLYVYVDDEKQERRLIDSSYFADCGLVRQVAKMTSTEEERFVEYAESVDDGEAQSLAIAKERGLGILTDDVAGGKLAVREGIELLTTIGLVRLWSVGKPIAEVRTVLKRIAQRGRYRPPTDHPDYAWYVAVISQ